MPQISKMSMIPTTQQRKMFFSAAVLVCLVSLSAAGANRYVRPGGARYGSGNGGDWANAFSGFASISWSSVHPGDTIFIAGGRYTDHLRIRASGTPAARVVVRRATSQRHGTGTGWSSSFDSQVRLDGTGISMANDYVVIDGAVKDGIKIRRYGTGRQDKGVEFVGECNYVTIRYLEIEGPGYPTAADGRGIDLTPYPGTSDSITVEHCRIYNFPNGVYLLNCREVLIQYCEISDMSCTGSVHENGVYSDNSHYVTYRYNKMWNAAAEGVFPRSNQSHWYVYGNTFRDGLYGVATKADYVHTDMHVYNNTFINLHYPIGFKNSSDNGSARNNIIYDCTAVMWGGLSRANNWIECCNDPFVDLANGNLQLREGAAPVNAGVSLSSEYSHDMYRRRRGADGAWDIGALERTDGTVPEPFEPTEPTQPQIQELVITSTGLPEAEIATQYSAQLRAEGGVEPYEWSLREGVLPNGLSFSSEGTFEGIPTVEGTYSLTIEVTDSRETGAHKPIVLSIRANEAPRVTGVELMDFGTLKVLFSENLDSATATRISNYRIEPPLDIDRITMNGTEVLLRTSVHHPEQAYQLCVENVTERAPATQAIAPSCIAYRTPGRITFEAENAVAVAPLAVLVDPEASGERCLGSSISEDGLAEFTLNISKAGVYAVQARVKAPSLANNSFYLSIDEKDSEIWDIVSAPTEWTWVPISKRGAGDHDDPEIDSLRVHLDEGLHTLTFRTRERGTYIDQISIDLIPEPDTADETIVELEAEDASAAHPMQVYPDPAASGGYYAASPVSLEGTLTFSVDVVEGGVYQVYARTLTGGLSKNSFFYEVNGAGEEIWDVVSAPTAWDWVPVSLRGKGTYESPETDTLAVSLLPGTNRFVFRSRERQTQLDKIRLKRVERQPVPEPFEIEAEAGVATSPMQSWEGTDEAATVYVASPQSQTGSLDLEVTVPVDGKYALSARVRAVDASKNSFYVSIDGNTRDVWDIVSMPTDWEWVPMSMRAKGTFEDPEFDSLVVWLSAGTHRLTFSSREKRTCLDKIRLTYYQGETSVYPVNGMAKRIPEKVALNVSGPRSKPIFSFSLPRTSKAVLDIYSVSGRRVRRLIDRSMKAGKHEITWDRRDLYGSPLPQGSYVAKLVVGTKTFVRTISLLPPR